MAGRKDKVKPKQGRLPLEFPAPERYDPRDGDEPVFKKHPKSHPVSEKMEQLSLFETSQIIRDSGSQKWNFDKKKKDEKPISAPSGSISNLNPFIDQFCEQVARIVTKRKNNRPRSKP